MATGIYLKCSEQWLLEYRDEILANIRKAANGRISSIGGGSKNHSKLLLSIEELRNELEEVNAALTALDPTTYPPDSAGGLITVEFA